MLVRAAISLVESAATSVPLSDEMTVVLRLDTWLVVRAPMAPVESAPTCELSKAAMAAVLMSTTSAAEI